MIFSDPQNDNSPVKAEGKDGRALLVILALVFLPALLIALGKRLLLTRMRIRPLMLGLYGLGIDLAALVAWKIGGFATSISHPASLLPAYILVCVLLGTVGGFLWSREEVKRLKAEPWRLKRSGAWSYKFEFRSTPFEKRARKRKVHQLEAGLAPDPIKVPLGLSMDGKDNIVSRYYEEARLHTLITGASGAGKTTFTMLPLIRGDIANGFPTIVIDFKRDPKLAERIASWTDEFGGDFYHFVNDGETGYNIPKSQGQCFYDPFTGATPTAMADMLLGMREYDQSSAVYKASMQHYLQVMLQALFAGRRSSIPFFSGSTIDALARSIRVDKFAELQKAAKGQPFEGEVEDLATRLKAGKDFSRHSATELQGQVNTLTASEYGKWLRPASGERTIDLLHLSRTKGSVVLFSLNSDSEPDFSKVMGSLILSNVTNVSAQRRNAQDDNQVCLYVDEFQIVPPSSVKGLLEKSRASKIACTLALQSFEQITVSGGEAGVDGDAYLTSILDTCSNFITHNGAVQDSAERLAGILGKGWRDDHRESNRHRSYFQHIWTKEHEADSVQTSQIEDWKFAPENFMTLQAPNEQNGFIATAVFTTKSCADQRYVNDGGAVARKIRLVPPKDVFSDWRPPVVSAPKVEVVPSSIAIEDDPMPVEDEVVWTRIEADGRETRLPDSFTSEPVFELATKESAAVPLTAPAKLPPLDAEARKTFTLPKIDV